jgi:hypothetical protein
MKKLLLFALLSGGLVGLHAQKLPENKVPKAVRDGFSKQYPNTKAKWEKEDGNYEAVFTSKGTEMSVVITNNGTIIETEMEIPASALPGSVATYIAQHYKGAKVKEAAKITDARGTVTYEAEIKDRDLIFDTNGKFIREVKKSKKEKEEKGDR